MLTFRTIFKSVLALLLVMGAAAAAVAEEIVISTTACLPVPEDATIVLTPVDDSPLSLEIRSGIEDVLKSAGYQTRNSGSLELRYHTVERGQAPATDDRSMGQLEIGGGLSLQLNIWSSTNDSVIGGRRPRPHGRYETWLNLVMELDRIADRRCVWRGEAAASLVGWRHGELATRLAAVLVDEIGGDSDLREPE